MAGGYSVQAQIALFRSIKPLFSNKLVFIVSDLSKFMCYPFNVRVWI